MVEEGFSPDMGFEAGGNGEGGNEVSPEDLVRVQENVRNAKKAAGNTAKSQRANKQYALMLSFIFKHIEDEWLLGYVFELMSKYQIDTICIFGHFLPQLQEKMLIISYKPLYTKLWDNLEKWEYVLSHIGSYYTELYEMFPQLQNIPKKLYIEFVMKQLEIAGITAGAEEKVIENIRAGLQTEIFKGKR